MKYKSKFRKHIRGNVRERLRGSVEGLIERDKLPLPGDKSHCQKQIAMSSQLREFPFTDEMLECETGSLLGRVADLERQSLAQRDEIVCLRATLADALRRIAQLEGRDKREDERNERRSERLVSSPLRNGHVPLRSKLDVCRSCATSIMEARERADATP